MGMGQGGGGVGFAAKGVNIENGEVQDFDGGLLRVQQDVLAQVDAGEATIAEAADEAVAAKLLAGEVVEH